MAKATIRDWSSDGIPIGRQYTRSQFSAILTATGIVISWRKKLRLRRRLELMVKWYQVQAEWHSKPTPSSTRDHFEGIANKTSKLLVDLGAYKNPVSARDLPKIIREPLIAAAEEHGSQIGGYDEFPPHQYATTNDVTSTTYHGAAKLSQIIENLHLLREWAYYIEAETDKGVQREQARHMGSAHLDAMLLELSDIYKEAFDRPAGITRSASNDSAPNGPWMRFANACLKPIESNEKSITMGALAERWRRIKG